MNRGLWLGVLFCATCAAHAHRIDEYLQATRLGLGSNDITVEIDLTPGALTAPRIIPLLDLDGDGKVSPKEKESYTKSVLAALTLQDNGQPLPLTLVEKEFPAVDQMQEGSGTMRLIARAILEQPVGGKHSLYFRNDHQTNLSVYVVNALLPPAGIQITSQHRDELQREFQLEALWSGTTQQMPRQNQPHPWLGLGVVALCAAVFHKLSKSKFTKPRTQT